MTTYAFRSDRGDIVATFPEFAKPTPAHALTRGALDAVEAVRRDGYARRGAARFTTDVGRPAAVAYDRDPVTASARTLAADAEAAGFEVRILSGADWCRVEGLRRAARVGFRATWLRGAADGASWHEPWRYELVADDRPVRVNAKTRTGLKGYRSAGVGVTRLSIVATPWGTPLTVTQLRERIAGL